MHFVDQSSEDQKLRYLEPFVWTFTGLTLAFTAVNLVNFLVMFVKIVWALSKRCKKKKPVRVTIARKIVLERRKSKRVVEDDVSKVSNMATESKHS